MPTQSEKEKTKKIIQSFSSLWFIEEESTAGIGTIIDVCYTYESAVNSLEDLRQKKLQSLINEPQGISKTTLNSSYYIGREEDPNFYLPIFRILSAEVTLNAYGYNALNKWL